MNRAGCGAAWANRGVTWTNGGTAWPDFGTIWAGGAAIWPNFDMACIRGFPPLRKLVRFRIGSPNAQKSKPRVLRILSRCFSFAAAFHFSAAFAEP